MVPRSTDVRTTTGSPDVPPDPRVNLPDRPGRELILRRPRQWNVSVPTFTYVSYRALDRQLKHRTDCLDPGPFTGAACCATTPVVVSSARSVVAALAHLANVMLRVEFKAEPGNEIELGF